MGSLNSGLLNEEENKLEDKRDFKSYYDKCNNLDKYKYTMNEYWKKIKTDKKSKYTHI